MATLLQRSPPRARPVPHAFSLQPHRFPVASLDSTSSPRPDPLGRCLRPILSRRLWNRRLRQRLLRPRGKFLSRFVAEPRRLARLHLRSRNRPPLARPGFSLAFRRNVCPLVAASAGARFPRTHLFHFHAIRADALPN